MVIIDHVVQTEKEVSINELKQNTNFFGFLRKSSLFSSFYSNI
jgi:hypothetical protein